MITVMLVMVLLLALALAAADSSILETRIAANHREYTENFYSADGAAMEGAELIAAEPDSVRLDPKTSDLTWLDQQKPAVDPAAVVPDPASNDRQFEPINDIFDDPAVWEHPPNDRVPRMSALGDNDNRLVRQMAIRTNIDSGSSARLNSPDRVTVFLIHGFSRATGDRGGAANIVIGYARENGASN